MAVFRYRIDGHIQHKIALLILYIKLDCLIKYIYLKKNTSLCGIKQQHLKERLLIIQ